MPVRLNGATSGYTELSAPAVAGITTMTMPTASGTLDRLERSGNILQVVQNYVDTTSSVAYTTGTMFDIPVSTSITPTYSSSKILVRVRWNGEINTTSSHEMVFRLKRSGTLIGNPASASARPVGISVVGQGYWNSDASSTPDSTWFEYLDSPNTTSSVTYQLSAMAGGPDGTLHTNRSNSDIDAANYERLTSSITLIEVAG